MKRALQWQLAWRRLGVIPALAIACAFAACLAWAWYLSIAPRPAAIGPTEAAAPAARPKPRKDSGLAEFQALLGPRGQTDAQVKLLFDLAKRHKLVLAKGQYQSAQDGSGLYTTYRIVLPVSGKYQDVWAFAEQALIALPYAALDDISFKRDDVADAQTETQLRFTLYLSAGAAR